MSSDGNESSKFLNAAVPLASLAVLNTIGFILLWVNMPNPGAGLFLAEIALIAITMTYFFLKAVVKETMSSPAARSASAESAPPVDVAKTFEVKARLDQLMADVDVLKRKPGRADLGPLQKQVSALQEQIQSVRPSGDDIARIRREVAGLSEMANEVAKLRDLRLLYDEIKEGQQASQADRKALSGRIETVAGQMAGLRSRLDESGVTKEQLDGLRGEVSLLKTSLQNAVQTSDLQAFVKSSSERIQRLEKTVDDLADTTRLDRVAAEMAKAREELASSARAQAKDFQEVVDNLKRQIAEIKERLAEMEPSRATKDLRAAFEKEMGAFRRQIEQKASAEDVAKSMEEIRGGVAETRARLDGIGAEKISRQLTVLDEDIAALKEALSGAAAAKDLKDTAEGLRREIETIRARVEEIPQAAAPEDVTSVREDLAALSKRIGRLGQLDEMAEEMEALRGQVQELHGRLDQAPKAATIEDVEAAAKRLRQEIAACRAQIEQAPKGAASEEMLALREDLAAVKQRTDGFADADRVADAVKALQDQIGDLQVRLDQAPAAATREDVSALRKALEAVEKKTAAARHEDLARSMASLQKEVGDLRYRLAEVAGAPRSEEVASLHARFEEMARQIEPMARKDEVMKSVEALDRRMGDLQACLDRLPVAATQEEVSALRQGVDGLKQGLAAAAKMEEEVRRLVTEAQAQMTKHAQAVEQKLSAESNAREDLSAAIKAQLAKLKDRPQADDGQARKLAAIEDEIGTLKHALASTQQVRKDLAETKSVISAIQAELSGLKGFASEVSGLKGEVKEGFTALKADRESSVRSDAFDKAMAELRAQVGAAEELARRSVDPSRWRDLSKEITEMRERLDGVEAIRAEFSKSGQAIREIEARLSAMQGAIADGKRLSEGMASLQGQVAKLGALEKKLDQLDSGLSGLSGVPSQLKALGKALEGRAEAGAMEQALAKVRQDQERLVGALKSEVAGIKEKVEELVSKAGAIEAIGALRGQLAEQETRLGKMASSDEVEKRSGEMRKLLAEMNDRLAEIAASTERGMDEVKDRLAAQERRLEAVSEDRPAKEMAAKLKAGTDRLNGVETIRAESSKSGHAIREIEARLSILEAAIADGKRLSEGMESLRGQVAKLGALEKKLGQLDVGLSGLSGLPAQLEALGKAMEDRVETGSLEQALAKVRQDQEQSVETLKNEVAEIKEKIEDLGSKAGALEAIGALRQQLAEQQARLGKMAASDEMEKTSGEIRKLMADMNGRVAEIAVSTERGMNEVKGRLAAQERRLEAVGDDRPAKEMAAKLKAEIERLDSAAKAAVTRGDLEGARQEMNERIGKLRALLEGQEALVSKKIEEKVAELRQSIESMRGRLKVIPDTEFIQALAQELKAEMKELRAVVDQGVAQAQKKVTEVSGSFSKEMEALRHRLNSAEEAPAETDAIAEEIRLLRDGLGVLESFAEKVTTRRQEARSAVATATEKLSLTLRVSKPKLVRTADGSLVECVVAITNPSDQVVEITAVKAELGSGKARMTPTVNKYWLAAGVKPDRERKVELPVKVLNRSTSPEYRYVVTGWPLEKTMPAYPFKITLKDEFGEEHTATVQLSPPA